MQFTDEHGPHLLPLVAKGLMLDTFAVGGPNAVSQHFRDR
jgi:hypothetical protein